MITALFNFCKFSYIGCVRNVKQLSHIIMYNHGSYFTSNSAEIK